jgi:hypothetical protein
LEQHVFVNVNVSRFGHEREVHEKMKQGGRDRRSQQESKAKKRREVGSGIA